MVICSLLYALTVFGEHGAYPVEALLWISSKASFVPALLTALVSGDAPMSGVLALLSSLFVHASLMHLAANGFFLWIVGRPVEAVIGSWRFLMVYLCSGVAGNLLHWLSDTGSDVPVIGASGAISGIFAIYLLLFSSTRVADKTLLGFVVSGNLLRILWFLAMWLGIQLITGLVMNGNSMATGIAIWAHIGGFIAGLAFGLLLARPPSTTT